MLKSITEDWKVGDKSKRYEVMKYQAITNLAVKFSLIVAAVIIILYATIKLVVINLSEPNKLSDSLNNSVLLLSSKFFFETNYSPIYEIVWFGQIMTSFLCGVIFVDYDGFFMLLIMHLCAQLSILKLDIRNSVSLSKKLSFNQVIKAIAQRHLQLRR